MKQKTPVRKQASQDQSILCNKENDDMNTLGFVSPPPSQNQRSQSSKTNFVVKKRAALRNDRPGGAIFVQPPIR